MSSPAFGTPKKTDDQGTPPGGHLLVVDDNAMNRDMLSRRLQRTGHTVYTAENGQEALDRIEAEPFDLVLLDVNMPVLDGFATLEHLRQTRDATELPVIMATALDQSDDVVRALKLGANDYVTKPIDYPVLKARVQTHLALKHSADTIRGLSEDLRVQNQQLESANTRMKNDLDAAAAIQQAGLPIPGPAFEGVRCAWAYQPCDELGGDALNVFELDGRHLGFYVLDVSGHGVPAALLSYTLNRELFPSADGPPGGGASDGNSVQGPHGPVAPRELAAQLNHRYPIDMRSSMYFTILYGLFDRDAGRLRFTSAGHPGLIHAAAQRPAALVECSGPPIGFIEKSLHEEIDLEVASGDRVFLFSDGLVEQFNQDEKQFGFSRILAHIEGHREEPLQACVDSLIQKLRDWARDGHLDDDLSMLALEID